MEDHHSLSVVEDKDVDFGEFFVDNDVGNEFDI